MCNIWYMAATAGDDAGTTRLEVPRTINKYLRDYQRQGVHFLFHQYSMRSRKHPAGLGAILGDDMGLGALHLRAVQALAHQNQAGLGQSTPLLEAHLA